MNATIEIMRESMHRYIETVTSEKLRAIYLLLKDDVADMEAYNNDIDQAEKEMANGDFYTHNQALEAIKQWKEIV